MQQQSLNLAIEAKKIKEGAKFSLTISVILNYSNGQTSFQELFDKLSISEEEFTREMFRLNKSKLIKIPNYELLQLTCPTCKSEAFKFVPLNLIKASPQNYLRFQITPPTCDHTFYVIYDKKGKGLTFAK